MSKNSKVILASVGILIALMAAVLLIRSPGEKKAVAPAPTTQAAVTPQPESTPKEMDDSHKKVTKVIDATSEALKDSAPGVWDRVKQTWDWLMGFDTKYAIIVIVVLVFIIGLVITGNHKGQSNQKNQR